MLKSNALKMIECKKKIRGENWHPEDKELLQQLVREKVAIIENKNTDTNTNYRKVKAWRAIAESFNIVSLSKRNVAQLKCQWNIIKMNAKKISQLKSSSTQNANKASPDNPNSVEHILDWLPKHSESNDQTVFKVEKNSTAEPNLMEEDNTFDAAEYCSVSTDANDAVGSKALRNKPKKQPAIFEHTSASTNEPNFEMICRAELHQAQLENEHRKARNLDLEHKILLEQFKFYKKKNETNF